MAGTYPLFSLACVISIESLLHAAYSARSRGGEVTPRSCIHLSPATPACRRTYLSSAVCHVPPPLEQTCFSPTCCLFVFNLKGNTFVLNLCPFYNSRDNKMLRTFWNILKPLDSCNKRISLKVLEFFKESLFVFKMWRMWKGTENILVT